MEKFHPYLYLGFPGFTEYPNVIYSWVVMLFVIVTSLVITKALQVIPHGGQNIFETLFDAVASFMDGTLGPQGRAYFPLVFTLAIYIFLCNVIGIIPGFMSPTTNLNTNIGCALTVFIATHYVGLKKNGLAYLKHFTGPIIWLAPLMVPIEIISHLARPLSLSLRLFGNITGEESRSGRADTPILAIIFAHSLGDANVRDFWELYPSLCIRPLNHDIHRRIFRRA